jgi:hypothetical protein
MSTELNLALLVFGGMLVIALMGYWASSRRADAIERFKRDRPGAGMSQPRTDAPL